MDILDLENNQLTNVSEDLKNLSILRILKLKENAFKKFPEVLLDWYSISHFGNRWNYCLGRSYYKGLPIVNLLSKKAFKLLSRKEKINYFHIYLNDKTKISRIDKKILLLALNSKLSMVAKYPRLFDQNFKFGASKRI